MNGQHLRDCTERGGRLDWRKRRARSRPTGGRRALATPRFAVRRKAEAVRGDVGPATRRPDISNGHQVRVGADTYTRATYVLRDTGMQAGTTRDQVPTTREASRLTTQSA